MNRMFAGLLALLLLGSTALADSVRPVTLRLKEQEPGLFLVQWRVPAQLSVRALPSPVLPESCAPVGDRSRIERSGTWLLEQRYRCPEGLSGQLVGIRYPFFNVAVSTLLRIELLSGERYAHMLPPGENEWRVPASLSGGVPPWLQDARANVRSGVQHFALDPLHWVFLLSLLLLGTLDTALRLATAFTAAQLLSVVVGLALGTSLDLVYAELGVAVAAVLLAREVLRPVEERRQLIPLALAAGLVHGLGVPGAVGQSLSGEGPGLLASCLVVLGLDATLVVALLILGSVGKLVSESAGFRRLRAPLAYLGAGVALALALVSPTPWAQNADAAAPTGLQLPDLGVAGSTGSGASRRLAAQRSDAALQSFLSIEAFETRHEVLVRLRDLAELFELDPMGVLEVEGQEALKRRLLELVTTRAYVRLNDVPAKPIDQQVSFLTLDATGALPRPAPVPEPVEMAWLGVTGVYRTEATPREASVTWDRFDLAATIPATVTDPESSRSVELTPGTPTLHWKYELEEDPAPVVRATAVEAETLWIPLLALAPLLAAAVLGWRSLRGRSRGRCLAGVRVLLAAALLLAPLGGTAWTSPFSAGAAPDASRARQILAGVLPNLYRSFEFPTESVAYDHLALTVTGDALSEIYLEHRRAVEMEERGGARARVEAVEVVEVDGVEPGDETGFIASATWTAGGTVTHFGHRHFRQNGYRARVGLVPVDGFWKIRSIDLVEEQRLR